MRLRLAVRLLALFGALTGLTTLGAQPDSARYPSAELLRRLGEAVDGYRAGGTAFVVATTAPPYTVFGVYGTRQRADSVARAAPRAASVYGPYTSTTDGQHVMSFAIDTCVHYRPTRIDCPNFQLAPAGEFVPVTDVDSVIVTVRLRTGRTRRIAYGPELDALFFTPAAIDKFVIPYYVRIIGVDSAAAMRRRMLQRLP